MRNAVFDYLSLPASPTALAIGLSKNPITRRVPVTISALACIPGDSSTRCPSLAIPFRATVKRTGNTNPRR